MNALRHRYHPWSLLDKFFEYPFEGEAFPALERWTPSVDIKSEEKRYVIFVDVPGVDPDKIEVYTEENDLIIKGERKTETKESKEGYTTIERFSGEFYRRFTLPSDANGEKIAAKTKNGVLEIEIPKKTPAVSKKRVTVKG